MVISLLGLCVLVHYIQYLLFSAVLQKYLIYPPLNAKSVEETKELCSVGPHV